MSKPSIEEILAPKPEARPRIYAYSIDDKAHKGLHDAGVMEQVKLNKTIDARAVDYIGGVLPATISRVIDPLCFCELAADDPHALNVKYPAAFSVRPGHDGVFSGKRVRSGQTCCWSRHEQYG